MNIKLINFKLLKVYIFYKIFLYSNVIYIIILILIINYIYFFIDSTGYILRIYIILIRMSKNLQNYY